MGESVRPWLEADSDFFSPMPSENKRRKWDHRFFCFHGRDCYVGKSRWIYM